MPEPSIGELTIEEARVRMLAGIAPGAAERVRVDGALGRTLAEPVVALRDQPPFNASAMDGYAVLSGDARPICRLIGESAAGSPFQGVVRAGETVRIFTGAPVPRGCRVVVQERTTASGLDVTFEAHEANSDYVRAKGGDFAAGQTLLPTGARLDAWSVALAAAAGRETLQVAPRPRVAILSTGEEIVPAGQAAGEAQIFDSNGPALAALIQGLGGAAQRLAPARDEEAAIASAVESAGGDLVVTVGGASVGDHDRVKPALRRLGLTLAVETVRVRPGKPTWFGTLGDGRRVLGLPGNPASALVCAELFLRPLLMAWQGADPGLRMGSGRLAAPLPPTGPREHWMRARLSDDGAGPVVTPFSDQDSSLVTVLFQANALLRRPAGRDAAKAGDFVEVFRLDRL